MGSALSALLARQGVRVRPLVRPGKQASDGISWDPDQLHIEHEALEGIDALVHLAGDGIADGRWTEAKKKRIRESRVRGTSLLASALVKLSSPPKVWVSASGIGYYGDRGAERVDESGPLGNDFLASVVHDWEAAADPAEVIGLRVVHPRFGVVLAPHGGALQKMVLPFKLGLGGKFGSGKQGMSWIALEDALRAILHCIEDTTLSGAVNVCAPAPVSNAEFTRLLAKALHRPTLFSVPGPLARLALGEMADGALLSGVYALPSKLLESGFRFEQPELQAFFAQAFA
ncbi:MAG: hypothetical protein JWN48_57 [Myxococcaceae bacterium]|nr:hypothetical protein [Myxococcaceae bacterium]